MKKITSLFILVLAVILYSCQDKNAYIIEGDFGGDKYDGKTVYLQKADSVNAQEPTIIDSIVVSNGKFTFKGVEEEATLGFISVGTLQNPVEDSPQGTVVLEAGKIQLSFKENGDVALGGTPKNEQYNKMQSVMNKVAALYKEISEAGGIQGVPTDAAGKDPIARMETLQEEMKQTSFDFTKENIKNKAGQFIFYSTASGYTRDQLKEIVALSDSTFLQTPEMQMIQEELTKVVPEVGMSYADAPLVDIKGLPANLSEYVNGSKECIIIDFWASWCAPCIEEVPNLKKLYATYKNKGLEIVGVSEDDDRNAWLDAVKKHGMSWVQLADDQKIAAGTYGLQTIPHTVILDKNGIVVAKNLRGKELEAKVAKMLK